MGAPRTFRNVKPRRHCESQVQDIICPRASILQPLFHSNKSNRQYAPTRYWPTSSSLNGWFRITVELSWAKWTVVIMDIFLWWFLKGLIFWHLFNWILFTSVIQTNMAPYHYLKELLPCVLSKWIIHCWFFEQGHPFRSLFLDRLWVASCRKHALMPCFCTCEICDYMHLC